MKTIQDIEREQDFSFFDQKRGSRLKDIKEYLATNPREEAVKGQLEKTVAKIELCDRLIASEVGRYKSIEHERIIIESIKKKFEYNKLLYQKENLEYILK